MIYQFKKKTSDCDLIFEEIFEAINEGVKRSLTPIGANSSSAVHKVRGSALPADLLLHVVVGAHVPRPLHRHLPVRELRRRV